jgi:UDP-2,4-diacetamido-2,4,6-trideoxy-beta-L-altropyranose hydrolase
MSSAALVVFRVDAGVSMGLGHLSRCLTLAAVLRASGARILFLISPETALWSDKIRSLDFGVRVLDVESSISTDASPHAHSRWLPWGWAKDANECLRLLPHEPTWLVVDHYGIDENWERAMSRRVRKLMVIDDLADRGHACDALLDQNIRPKTSYESLVPLDCRVLIGPEYALLRPDFLAERRLARSGPATHLNVFMGGTDAKGATVQVLDEFASGGLSWDQLDIILGSRCPHLETVHKRAALLPNARLHVDCEEVASMFASADIGIGAGGVAALERCCVGLPSVTISVAENQNPGLAGLVAEGATIFLGYLESLRPGQIVESVRRLMADSGQLRRMSIQASSLVDGLGAHRVAAAMFPVERR